ncbi:hypothetical protein [Paraburkholderia sp. JHI869]|uniref:hypothetical protein n=1 Tax=Paraburkholderia sp. JHI869 TaxID=3112959 RepID=UPI00317C157F
MAPNSTCYGKSAATRLQPDDFSAGRKRGATRRALTTMSRCRGCGPIMDSHSRKMPRIRMLSIEFHVQPYGLGRFPALDLMPSFAAIFILSDFISLII